MSRRARARTVALAVLTLLLVPVSMNWLLPGSTSALPSPCQRLITANVVALDQPLVYNRMGVIDPVGMIYALRKDVVDKTTGLTEAEGGVLSPGNVQLRDDKRPRPLTLRMNVGDCMQVSFQNLLDPQPLPAPSPVDSQPASRNVGFHVEALQLVDSIGDDGSNVGEVASPGSLAVPGGPPVVQTLYAEREGGYLLSSPVDNVSSEGIGTSAFGLFGAVNVQPTGAEWYRSQLTRSEMELATTGATADNHPIIDYAATYPAGHRYAGLPILNVLAGDEIVHSDLTAIITGPGRGEFVGLNPLHPGGDGWYPPNPAYPNRNQPYREYTTIFHDENAVIQAFDLFEDPQFEFTLHSVRDSFAINYGTGGIGAEIIANRLGVGPMWNCTDCKYEEFFLTSWAVGDPAMIVDIPANADIDGDGQPDPGPKATKALYPDDPSNVYHSYLNDHVKFRNLSVGKEHHIFHLHAHQWLATPDDDNSTYLDSQAIGPGSGYTYEVAYNGGGNRNKTAGDSIFHCHFYPHFAQGMWSLMRVHDTFEAGTEMVVDAADGQPTPAAGARALPDGEIAGGTPIPALVPIPGLAMAPVPEADVQIVDGQADIEEDAGNPGYPFNIAGVAGHRPPTPPLDIVDDGGLPRHIITGGSVNEVHTTLDFTKDLTSATAEFPPELGTPVEQAAMAFHEQLQHPSFKPDGAAAQFETNGLPRTAGAPYADPCRNDDGTALLRSNAPDDYDADNPRIYKAAVIQLDMQLNKVGWHFPQARIITLWNDVDPTLNGARPPEPFVMRVNSNDCIDYYHTNLVPSYYEQDAFQVRTPTDVIGQHIHLVKFDVTSSDGSANGWNYEDGTLSPDEVRERIHAIRTNNGCTENDARNGTPDCPEAEAHPFFGPGPNGRWMGARTTVQRWYADPLLNNAGEDRTLGAVFTHDHFSPSTHQQVGLYGTLLVEPEGSTWRDSETGQLLGVNQSQDGGPTSWRCDIIGADPADSSREFFLEFGDFQLAYEAGRGVDADGNPIPDPLGAINPPGQKEVGLPDLIAKPNDAEFALNGRPEAISAADVGTFVVNYRNEPVPLRVRNPNSNQQAPGDAGDLSFAFSSDVTRADARLNVQPNFYPPLTSGVSAGDPFTPLLRAYDNDKVRVRVQVGATEEGHNVSIAGVKWRQEFASADSGWRNSQMMGISEQFIFDMPITPVPKPNNTSDYFYSVSSSVDGLWNGAWGIMRSQSKLRNDLLPLPNNPIDNKGIKINNAGGWKGLCPADAPERKFDVTAVLAANALPGGALVYNSRPDAIGPLSDPTAILYVQTSDLDATGKLKEGVPIEPLLLRASAGDCIRLTLRNSLPAVMPDLDGFNSMPPIVDGFNANDVVPSNHVGLRPQLVAYDVVRDEGTNIGRNSPHTVAPGGVKTYNWYAGDVQLVNGNLVPVPVEFGAVNLMSSDRIKHSNKGAIGALIIEPAGSTWVEDAVSRASATVTKSDSSSFRDFALLFQDDLNLRLGDGSPLPFIGDEEDSEDSGAKALNYRTEPLWFRLGIDPAATAETVAGYDFTDVLSNSLVGGDPETPIFTATTGEAVRFRVLEPGGHSRNHVFTLHGHTWQREPYVNGSSQIGDNPTSEWKGAQEGHGPTDHWDIVPANGAGGKFGVTGDYLYRDMAPGGFYNGIWGIFRVHDAPENVAPAVDTPECSPEPSFAGQGVICSATFTDDGIGGSPTCTIDYGDGSGPVVGTVSGSASEGTCSGPLHTYLSAAACPGGICEIVVTVNDGSLFSNAAASHEVNPNAAPVVAPPTCAPEPSQAGESVTCSAAFTDADGGDTHVCTVDYDDGSGAQAGVADAGVCTGPPHDYSGPSASVCSDGTCDVVVTVTDNHGVSGSNTATHVVEPGVNVPPVVGTPACTPEPSLEGEEVICSAAFTDDGSGGSPSCTVDYGDGSGPLPGSVSGSSTAGTCTGPAHAYADDSVGACPGGVCNVTVTVSDGLVLSSNSAVHGVNNAAPEVAKPSCSPSPSSAGESVTCSASFTDAGSADTHFCAVDYGDGSGPQAGLVAGGTCTGPAHTYTGPSASVCGANKCTVTVIVTDNGSASGTNTVVHVVRK